MKKHKKLLIAAGAILLIIALLHFAPFDSRSGYLEVKHINICIGNTKPVDYSYRWITGGVNKWDHEIDYLKKTNSGCDQPATIRLYIL